MSVVTRILNDVRDVATEKLLPLVYDELRQLAGVRMIQKQPGQTLTATALVHKAYPSDQFAIDGEQTRPPTDQGG